MKKDYRNFFLVKSKTAESLRILLFFILSVILFQEFKIFIKVLLGTSTTRSVTFILLSMIC